MIYYTSFKIHSLKKVFLIAKINDKICGISFSADKRQFVKFLKRQFNGEIVYSSEEFVKESRQLIEYFKGTRKTFSLRFTLSGTDFQRMVCRQIAKIGYGETLSYSDIAKRINNRNAVRAVGNACGKNPIPIIIPCRRVIAKNDSIGGFGGGISLKRKLLNLEKGIH
jgi:O-6-methylguanine DNA methyltransferase